MKESGLFDRYIREIREGKYVLHGSPKKLSVIEPRQAQSTNPMHAKYGVYATSYLNIALLYAAIHEDRTLWGWRADFAKSLEIQLVSSVPLQGKKGYLHVLPREPFEVVEEGFTLIARKPIVPKKTFSVDPGLLDGLQKEHLIRIEVTLAANHLR